LFLKAQDIRLSLKENTSIKKPLNTLYQNPDTVKPSTDSLSKAPKQFKMKKSPFLAVALSVVLPGAGQIYNGSYWKAAIIDGLLFYFGYEYYDNNQKFKDYRDQYNATITPEDPNGDPNLKTLRNFYQAQRDDFVWYFIIVYTLNLVDAYIDAHLFDFDVSDEKHISFGKPDKTYRLKMNINF